MMPTPQPSAPQVLLPPPHWLVIPRRARARPREGDTTHGRSDDAKHAGPFKVTRTVRIMVLIGPESAVIGFDRSVRVEKSIRYRCYRACRGQITNHAVGDNAGEPNDVNAFERLSVPGR